jgi:HEAT repeat protein
MSRFSMALLLGALLPNSAWASIPTDALLALLDGIEQSPTAQQLTALGEGVDEALVGVASDTSMPSSRRGRAISALAYFPTSAVRSFLEGQLADGDNKGLLRRKAALALGAGFSTEAVAVLTTALEDEDVQLRIATATALGKVGDEAAKAALGDRRGRETEDAVNVALDAALGVQE